MKRGLLFVTLLILLPGWLWAQKAETYTFVERNGVPLCLDVYRPANPRADRACVVSVFGGGFVMGSRDDKLQLQVAKLLTERGFTVVSIDYRLGLKDSAATARYSGLLQMGNLFQYCIDIAVEDCASAVAYVCTHANELNIDTSRMVLTGSSAGAITVLQLDYSRANALPTASALPEGWRPAAVVPYAGGVMCLKRDLKFATPPAPVMLMHGTKDKIVSYKHFGLPFSAKLRGANEMAKAYKRGGYPCWILRYQGIGHEVASFLPGSVDLFCGFVEQVFSGRVTWLDATVKDSKLVPTKWTKMNLFDLYK